MIRCLGRDWIKSKLFLYDVTARGASREQLQAIMQTLPADRFKLATHREQREMSYYALVPAKNGPRVQSVKKMRPVKEVPDDFRGTTYGGRIDSIPMPGLACLISRFETERPIIDQTRLSGMYGVKLRWTLRPEARKGPAEILVLEGAEKATAEN